MREHRGEALVQGASPAALQLVRRRRQVVAASDLRNPAQLPQRALEPIHERFEGLAERQAYPAPPAEAQNELEQQVIERLAGDPHPELRAVREVELRLPARRVSLLEVDLSLRPMDRAPVADPPLQGPNLPGPKTTRVAAVQQLEQRRRLQDPIRVAHQQRNDLLVPHALERIPARPPRPPPLRGRRQRPRLPLPSRPDAHPRRGRRRLLALPVHALLPQQPNLLVRHHPRFPLPRGSQGDNYGDEPAVLVVVERQK